MGKAPRGKKGRKKDRIKKGTIGYKHLSVIFLHKLSCPFSSLRNSTTPLTRLQQINSPYSIRVGAIYYASNNLVNVSLPAFLSEVIFLAFWNLDNTDSVPFPKIESSEPGLKPSK